MVWDYASLTRQALVEFSLGACLESFSPTPLLKGFVGSNPTLALFDETPPHFRARYLRFEDFDVVHFANTFKASLHQLTSFFDRFCNH